VSVDGWTPIEGDAHDVIQDGRGEDGGVRASEALRRNEVCESDGSTPRFSHDAWREDGSNSPQLQQTMRRLRLSTTLQNETTGEQRHQDICLQILFISAIHHSPLPEREQAPCGPPSLLPIATRTLSSPPR
jgi:hypothetical protein